jgi:uncharacterized membrane protein
MTRSRLILIGLPGVVFAESAAVAGERMPCAYEPLVVPYHHNVIGTDINNQSEACGYHFLFPGSGDFPFYWSAETGIVTLPFPSGIVSARAQGISEQGDIVGTGRAPTEARRPILWHNGVPQILSGPDGAPATDAAGIAGPTAVGWRQSLKSLALRWDNAEVSTILLPLGPSGEAWDIADGPLITGWMGEFWGSDSVAFLLHKDVITSLGAIPRGQNGFGIAVTTAGDVAMGGLIEIDGVPTLHSSLWSQGQHTDPGTLPGCHSTRIADVNVDGAMVGSAYSLQTTSAARSSGTTA